MGGLVYHVSGLVLNKARRRSVAYLKFLKIGGELWIPQVHSLQRYMTPPFILS